MNPNDTLKILSVELCIVEFKWLLKIESYGFISLDFYKLILFYRVLSELSDILKRLKKFKVIFEI